MASRSVVRMQAAETGSIVEPSHTRTEDVASGRGRCVMVQPLAWDLWGRGMARDGTTRQITRERVSGCWRGFSWPALLLAASLSCTLGFPFENAFALPPLMYTDGEERV